MILHLLRYKKVVWVNRLNREWFTVMSIAIWREADLHKVIFSMCIKLNVSLSAIYSWNAKLILFRFFCVLSISLDYRLVVVNFLYVIGQNGVYGFLFLNFSGFFWILPNFTIEFYTFLFFSTFVGWIVFWAGRKLSTVVIRLFRRLGKLI